jgi:hypothetical protein
MQSGRLLELEKEGTSRDALFVHDAGRRTKDRVESTYYSGVVA